MYTRRCLACACDYPAEAMALSHFFDVLGAVTSDEFKLLTTHKEFKDRQTHAVAIPPHL